MNYPITADCHVHSGFSHDVKSGYPDNVAALCESAIAKGLSYLAVTDHFDIDFQLAGIDPLFAFSEARDALLNAREHYRDRLYLALGIEYGQPYTYPEKFPGYLSDIPYDIVLGSVHSANAFDGLVHLPYRTMTEEERETLAERYLDAYEKLVTLDDAMEAPAKIDVYAHPTLLCRYFYKHGIAYPYETWEERMRSLFAHIIAKGKGIEFNVSCLRAGGELSDPSPVAALHWYKDCGGEIVTVGSDAHRPEDIASGFGDAAEILRSLGFRYYTVYKERKPVFYTL